MSKTTMKTAILLTSILALSLQSQAAVIFVETFEAYTPNSGFPPGEVDTVEIGTGVLSTFEVGSSIAANKALAVQNTDGWADETIFDGNLSALASGASSLADFTLEFAAAATLLQWENSQDEGVVIRFVKPDNTAFTATTSSFLPAGATNSNLSNGSTSLSPTFQNVSFSLSEFTGLTYADLSDIEIQVRIGSSSNAEDVSIDTITVSAIPEPSTLTALGLGVLGLLGVRRLFHRRA